MILKRWKRIQHEVVGFDFIHWMAWGDPRSERKILVGFRWVLPLIGFVAALFVALSVK